MLTSPHTSTKIHRSLFLSIKQELPTLFLTFIHKRNEQSFKVDCQSETDPQSEMCPSGRTLSQQQTSVSDFRPAFDVLDIDRDGKISMNDLKSFYNAIPNTNTASEEEIGSMISIADSNKNGFVELEEFEKVLGWNERSNNNSLANEVMGDVFRVMDKDGDGEVGFEDLRSYMQWAGFSTTDDDIRAMIKLGGGDEKNGVCYEGLLKILDVDTAGMF